MTRILLIGITVIISIFAAPSFCENLGSFGQVYPIMEENLLDFIQQRIKEMEKNGEWQKIENQFRERVERHVDRPVPIDSVVTAGQNRTFEYDPSITVPYDVRDATGRVVIQQGTTVNPLKYIHLHHALLFFNGDDLAQVAVAKKIDVELQGKVKLILINGSVSECEKQFKQPIYFDQEGRLVNRLSIQRVPALVQQQGLLLKISEIKP